MEHLPNFFVSLIWIAISSSAGVLIGKLVNSRRTTLHNRIVIGLGIFGTHATMIFLASTLIGSPVWDKRGTPMVFLAWLSCVFAMYCIWNKGMRVRRSIQSAIIARITLVSEFTILAVSLFALCLFMRG